MKQKILATIPNLFINGISERGREILGGDEHAVKLYCSNVK